MAQVPDDGASPTTPTAVRQHGENDLEALLDRINNLTSGEMQETPIASGPAESEPMSHGPVSPPSPDRSENPPQEPTADSAARVTAGTATDQNTDPSQDDSFVPDEPSNYGEAGISEMSVEELIIKYLFSVGETSGQAIADQVRIPFTMIVDLLQRLKDDQLIHYRGTTSINDYICQVTDLGRERARRLSMQCTYFGAAPVPLEMYCESVAQQSLQHQNPSEDDLNRAFSDLLINPKMLLRLGAAVNSGRGMFLYGYPGNGKTSIAERVTKSFGEFIWIPRAIVSDGEIIRLFDPSQHEEAPLSNSAGLIDNHRIDKRWVRIRRPTIVAGGELTMDNLELSMNHITGINESPLQLKSNCGTLVIDDFGRQRMTTDELLNRWIVPLEKRYDFLNLPSGKKIQVPFDQLVIFSTNLEPKDLVDDAFLRRIPYKIEVENPSESEFRQLFQIMCPKFKIEYNDRAIDYLIQKHYRPTDRPHRCCHPRDILLQINNYCLYTRKTPALTKESIDFAVSNYFAVM